jgi:sterol 3beta-glucosyltransferase
MMASEIRLGDRPGRKLTKKRRESRRVSLDIPERFRDGDDADEDVTAPKRKDTMSMNQSLFSMIARAGQQSQADLGAMQEVDSGDSEGESKRRGPYRTLEGAARLSRISTSNVFQHGQDNGDDTSPSNRHRRSLSEHRLLRSLPKLKTSGRKENKSGEQPTDQMYSSQVLPPVLPGDGGSEALENDRVMRSRPRVPLVEEGPDEKRRLSDRKSRRGSTSGGSSRKAPVTLAKRLQQIFEFETLEEVISGTLKLHDHSRPLTHIEYPCWLLQSILLQGYMYITQKHICFYAYIPKKHVCFLFQECDLHLYPSQHDVGKTGYLFKRGRSKYNRYWFILRGDVLSYYSNPAELYFPRNRINLQYAISAEVLDTKDKNKDETTFVVTTDERTYQFKADSAVSAKEWVRSIQKVIFRTHNEGNSVKISLPIQNVLEIEESTILDFADTFKVRVIDNDETYAIDEVRYRLSCSPEDPTWDSDY